MKFIKWKTLAITCVVCLAAIVPGVALWGKLPQSMAIHFDINNNPDNFAPKGFAVFGLPVIMMLVQAFCCVTNDIAASKHPAPKRLEAATKWVIPVLTIVLQLVTLIFSLGIPVDVRRVAVSVAGLLLIVTGSGISKLDYVKNYNIDAGKAKEINRITGIMTMIMGVLFLVSAFLPPVSSLVCLGLIVPYIVISVIVFVKKAKN